MGNYNSAKNSHCLSHCQSSIEGAMARAETSSNLRSHCNKDWLSAFVAAIIPVERAPLLRAFLMKHYKLGGYVQEQQIVSWITVLYFWNL